MSRSEFVLLRGGLAVPKAALDVLWELEGRGLHLAAAGDMVTVGPRALLTDDDRVRIRHWKPHLLAILTYDADAHQGVQ